MGDIQTRGVKPAGLHGTYLVIVINIIVLAKYGNLAKKSYTGRSLENKSKTIEMNTCPTPIQFY